ncbi:hypothetical protein ACFQ1L_35180 [Phytohabitans flavus]|uniref:hypothetical protein n=1 Tax=Phytohabitans flavus TaxID=1076124 RepID=UPI0036427EBA
MSASTGSALTTALGTGARSRTRTRSSRLACTDQVISRISTRSGSSPSGSCRRRRR